ncbi:Acetylornithine deacetylase/Succinyl-diaminopimelate desuccinylase [Robiginitalea myxolifaciens]|uniref:Acetylornithine deacetylase/Succinyl-diaminopimelate desuccinylase n=1 Tax=Robiginitalea myxolifaciens TaxID=400055 RepID=A0A1I6FPC9_9FLAO|nr:M20/M25/M40 family metallo-hydrolase [Robiginitalea myxolifaciens]SFR31734.1 Acetylornithine deacetylase/Succinyl-diaminopimelate desuccinylase [Robiginitalea myxolifaciens]
MKNPLANYLSASSRLNPLSACCVILTLLFSSTGLAQETVNTLEQSPQPSQAIESATLKAQVRHTIDELVNFIAIPNDALIHADINRNLNWLTDKFGARGFNTAILPTEEESLFFATLPNEENKPTLLLYMHFDGQSVDPSKWDQADPYRVVLKSEAEDGSFQVRDMSELNDDIPYDWRLFGRSLSDDKGPIVMLLNTIDLIKKQGASIPFNIKVILDGQEEKGSKPLPAAVETYKELLEADYLVIADGPVHYSGLPTIVYGCRGITTISLTTFGPIRPQHSGHYGNYAPNPGFRLTQLLAGMKDEQGRVLIPGYYDGITLDDATQEILRSVPDETERINGDLQIKQAEAVGGFYQEALQYPSLNLRGISSGWTGPEARTIVPATATAEIDIRLVPESDGDRLKGLVKQYIESQGYRITTEVPTAAMRAEHDRWLLWDERGVTNAFRTPLDDPFGEHLVTVLKTTFGQDPVQIRIAGGTVPIAPFVNALDIPAFLVPMVNPDNNQHSPNENLKIGQIAYGLQAFYAMLTTPLD